MISEFLNAKTHIEKAGKILLTTHERTDGDDLGTVLALSHLLRMLGKTTQIVIRGGTPAQLNFLPGSELVKEEIPTDFQPELVIYSGCSKKERSNVPGIKQLTCPSINFDHHPDNTLFGDVNVVEASKSSVAELTYDFFIFSNFQITADIATCLLTGIFTDTGSFMHSNTKQPTLLAAADLMKRGASLTKIAKHTYKGKNPYTLKAWGKALENTYYDSNKKVIYSVMTETDLSELKDIPLSAFEGFVETLNKVPEAKVALFLKQDGDTIKGSLRSDPHKGVDVQKVAKILGGGGHVWASGFSIIGKLEKDERNKWVVSPPAPGVSESITAAKAFLRQESSNPLVQEKKTS